MPACARLGTTFAGIARRAYEPQNSKGIEGSGAWQVGVRRKDRSRHVSLPTSCRSMFPDPISDLILIVEERSVARLVKSILTKAGHKALDTDAPDALRLIAQSECGVKLVITNRPQCFAGAVPLLYLAATPDWELAQSAPRLRILRKPFRAKDLVVAVEELTAQTGSAGG